MDHIQPLAEEPPPTVTEYLGVLRARRWTVILLTLAGLALGLTWSFLQESVYESRVDVLLKPVAGPPDLATEAQLAQSGPVADRVRDRVGSVTSTAELLRPLTVEVVPGTQILRVTYRASTGAQAQRLGQAWAEELLAYRRDRVARDLATTARGVRELIRRIRDQLAAVQHRIATTTDPTERDVLQAQAGSIARQIADHEQQLVGLHPPEIDQVGEVVEPASLPGEPIGPRHPLNGALGALLGLAAGIAVALWREHRERPVRSAEDLETHLGLPVLAVVPRVPGSTRDDPTLVSLDDPEAPAAEAYRTLGAAVMFAAARDDLKVLLVTSAQSEEGKTATVANLGVALAQAGRRIFVVDADLRKPRLHRFFGVPLEAGLVDVLGGRVRLSRAIVRTSVDNLRVLPGGHPPQRPADVLSSEAMTSLLDQMREISDMIIVDSPPLLLTGDALVVAPTVDGVILVADANRTGRDDAARARRQLSQVDVRVIGSVLNRYDPARARSRSSVYTYEYVDVDQPGEPGPP